MSSTIAPIILPLSLVSIITILDLQYLLPATNFFFSHQLLLLLLFMRFERVFCRGPFVHITLLVNKCLVTLVCVYIINNFNELYFFIGQH